MKPNLSSIVLLLSLGLLCVPQAMAGSSSKEAADPLTTEKVLSLKEVPVPVPQAVVIVGSDPKAIPGPDVKLTFQPLTVEIVKDQAALIRLGKSLFWDMQVGSDGAIACATCHHNAGGDVRTRSQISPGADAIFGNTTLNALDSSLSIFGRPELGPNFEASTRAFPFPFNDWAFRTFIVPRGPGVTVAQELGTAAGNPVTDDTNDVWGSQGIRKAQFVGITLGSALEQGTQLPDIFNTTTPGLASMDGRVRRVTGRNAPTPINAVFNYDNFLDGRASFVFNGVNPFGFRDRSSTLKRNDGGTLTDVFIRVINSSLASQAVGPPLSDTEMSFSGRTFPDIGKKLLSLQPLAQQLVAGSDSVLGKLSGGKKPGLTVATYVDLIQAAFQPQWWSSTSLITVSAGKSYTQMAYNFSLFFGLAVQAYEATLVSDDTPFDRFMGAPSLGIPANPAALTDQQRVGLSIFMDEDANLGAKCNNCHRAPIMTGATVLDYQPDDQGVPSLGLGEAIELMQMGDDLASANYDHGMYNIGVRPTADDIGRGGTAPNATQFLNPMDNNNPFPLSLTELTALGQDKKLPPDVARFVPDVPILPRRVTHGAFKAANLRNCKLTGPYFHNGDSATLREVVEFYVRGGNFPNTNLHDKTVDVDGIPLMEFPDFDPQAEQRIEGLVSFLAEGLLDQRVAYQQAPFDHPQLFIPNGVDTTTGLDSVLEIPAVGQKGNSVPLSPFLNLDPRQ